MTLTHTLSRLLEDSGSWRVRVASAISLIVSVNESAQIAPRFDEGCKIEIPRDAFSTRGPVR